MERNKIDIRKAFGAGIGGENFGDDKTEYKFGRIKRLKKEYTAKHPGIQVLDFGIGEPFEGPDIQTRRATASAILSPDFDGYPDLGLPELRQEVAKHFKEIFGIEGIDPETNVQDCWGIKPGLDKLATVFCAPGNQRWPRPRIKVAVTTPGYSVFATQAAKLGAKIIEMPLKKKNNYMPNLSKLTRVKNLHAIYLIIPDNPSGIDLSRIKDFLFDLVQWCKDNKVALIIDEAYVHLRWLAEKKPFTALSIPGFIDVGVVCQSVSKTFNWTGGRVGWIVGDKAIIAAYRKEYEDSSSGQTLANQYGAVISLRNFNSIVPKIRTEYQKRFTGLIKVLQPKNFPVSLPDGGFFLYCPAPISGGGQTFANADDFMDYLLNTHGIVSVPFDDHIRFSVTTKVGEKNQPETYEQALKLLSERLPNDLAFPA